jgi:anti-sigma regulatory factor (Ser/Thr protein kinase)
VGPRTRHRRLQPAAPAAAQDGHRARRRPRHRKVGLRANRLIDLEIAVTELATNSIRHGGGTGMLRVWAEGDRLVCEVADAGHLTDPLAGHRPVEDDHGGHGLLLVNHVVDLLRTHTGAGGTTMRIHMKLDPDQGHRSA